MYGAVPPPPPARTPPAEATAVTLRVLLCVCSVFSCALLSVVPLLRIAFLRRRWYDWTVAGVGTAAALALFVVVGEAPEDTVTSYVAVSLLLACAVGFAVYYLAVDIRIHRQRKAAFAAGRAFAGAPPVPYPHPVPPQPGYGYPPQLPTPGASTFGPALPATPFPQAGLPPAHLPAPPGAAAGPAERPRIEQVRAELDELSDLLRKEQDDR